MNVEVVTLRTGAKVPAPLVNTVTLVLERLMDTNTIALYEAVMMAREPGYVPFGNTGDVLRQYDFIGNYPRLHKTVRDILLAAAEGDGAELHLVSPYAATGATS